MASVTASATSSSSAANIMSPEFFSSLRGSPSFTASKVNSTLETATSNLNRNSKQESQVPAMTAAVLSSAVRNMLSSEFLRQKWRIYNFWTR